MSTYEPEVNLDREALDDRDSPSEDEVADEYRGCATYDNRGVCNCSAGMPGGCQMERRHTAHVGLPPFGEWAEHYDSEAW